MFFRAGVLGLMEEIREEKIAQILSQLQSFIRGHMSRLTYKKLQSQKVAIMLIINLQYTYIHSIYFAAKYLI